MTSKRLHLNKETLVSMLESEIAGVHGADRTPPEPSFRVACKTFDTCRFTICGPRCTPIP
jgi:hypothetical protein